jgi:preprotein translocase subunit YajC
MIAAGLAIMVAGVFVWRRDFDAAFVAAALGVIAWFLNYRAQMKETTAAADLEEVNKGDDLHED